MAKKYNPPYTEQQILDAYGQEIYDRLMRTPEHKWRAQTGIELIHKEPTLDELIRIADNWQRMSRRQKKLSDRKSRELYGMDNMQNYEILKKLYG